MAVDKNRQLKPGPAGKTAERAHYIRLMKQGFNNSEACRIVGVGRKTGSHWRNGRTVRDPATGRLLAGARESPESHRLVDTAAAMRRGVVRRGYDSENTTLAVVATNARLTKVQATKIAQMAHQGLVLTVVPVHTTLDGDLVIGLGTGPAEGGIEADLNAVGLAAADAVAEAVVRAVKTATTLGGLPAWSDLRT